MDETPTSKANIPPTQGRWEWAMKLAPIFLVLATGVFYLNGIAFHQGFLGHFHLMSSMFDDDVGSQVAFAVRGWEEINSYVVGNAGVVFVRWILPSIVTVIGICAVLWRLERWLLVLRRAKRARGLRISASLRRKAVRRKQRAAAPPRFKGTPLTQGFALTALCMFMAGGTLFCVVDCVGFALGICVLPFGAAGEELAAKEEAKAFADSPLVTVTAPDGSKLAFRVITCAPRFCALYRPEQIVTVPAGTMTWLSHPTKPAAQAPTKEVQQPQQPQSSTSKSTS